MTINRGILRDNIVLFLDNCPAHTAYYALWNLNNLAIKILFNCACTPAFNIIENVFCDMKFHIRRKNKKSAEDIIQEARNFLRSEITPNYMMKKMLMSC